MNKPSLDRSDPKYWDKVFAWKDTQKGKRTLPPYICFECGSKTVHIYRYDRYSCPKCMEWAEPGCSCPSEEECPFDHSPDKPIQEMFDDPDAKCTSPWNRKR